MANVDTDTPAPARRSRKGDNDTTSGNAQGNINAEGNVPEAPGARASEEVVIAGQRFRIPNKYSAGHVINENEAARLNQDVRENVRNNFAAKVKEGGVTQEQVDTYLQSYQFGVRVGGGGRTSDPVEKEARLIARGLVEKQIKGRGEKLADYETAAINEAINEALEKYPRIRETAQRRVAEQQELASGLV